MGMTQAAYEALSAEKKQAALDRARQMFLEAGANDVLLNIEQLPAWIQANAKDCSAPQLGVNGRGKASPSASLP